MKKNRNAHTIWNTNKDGGWNAFKTSTEDTEEFDDIFCDVKKTTTENVVEIEKKLTKKKFAAFGKVKQRNNNQNRELKRLYEIKSAKLDANTTVNEVDKAIGNELLEIQKVDVEKGIKEVMMMKNSKGKSAAIFKTLQKINGSKKTNQEQVAMKHPETDLEIFEPKEIKSASLEYCVNLLTKKNCHEEYKDDFYIQDMIHLLRCEEEEDDEYNELQFDDFNNRMKVLKTKCKEKYQFVLKAGEGYKGCLYKLFSKVWKLEDKPQQWRDTIIVQLYKGKGEESCFNNQRNIHTKGDAPKFFEGIVVDKAKPMLTSHRSFKLVAFLDIALKSIFSC